MTLPRLSLWLLLNGSRTRLGEPLNAEQLQHLPSLRTMLDRFHRRDGGLSPGAWHRQLPRMFGVNDGASVAELTRLADDIPPREGHWLRADPVHMVADQSTVLLMDREHLQLDASEADALVGSLNRHFGEDGWRFAFRDPMRWFVCMERPLQVRLTALAEAAGGHLTTAMPTGADGARLRRAMNEAQMLLHTHPVNEARRARSLPEINAVWFWGNGTVPKAGDTAPWQEVSGNAPLLRGLAKLHGLQPAKLPPSAQEWFARAPSGRCLMLMRLGQDERSLRQWESRWFAPLRDRLRRGHLGELVLLPFDAERYHGQKWTLWRLWARRRAP